MLPLDGDRQLLDWIARRLDPETVSAAETQRLQSLLDANLGVPFTDTEITRILQKAKGNTPLHAERRTAAAIVGAAPSLLRLPPHRFGRYAWPAAVAAAACLLLLFGGYVWNAFNTVNPGPDPGLGGPTLSAQQSLPVGSTIQLLDRQAMVRIASPDTLFTIISAESGQLRLDQGSIYLEMFPRMGLEVEIQTAFGKITATDARCYLSCPVASADSKGQLTALILDGQIEITNSQGYELGEAGEVLLVKADTDPDKIGPDPYFEDNRDWVHAQEVLQLLQNPEVHEQLKLPAGQREKFNRPVSEEAARANQLLSKLIELTVATRRQGVAGYFAWLADQLTALLDANQKKQFRQLHLQQIGLTALGHRDVVAELKISDQQHKQINTQLQKYCAAQKNLFVHGSGTSFELCKALTTLQKERDEALMKVLKPQQKQQWEKMAPPPSLSKIGEHINMGLKGFSFSLLSFQSKSEEQLWDVWLQQTAKRAKMSSQQQAEARAMLQVAKKDAADYRKDKNNDFKQLADESIQLLKSKKPDWPAFQKKAEKLQLPVAQIGQEWKEEVLDLLTADQRKAMEQSSQKELPPWLEAIWKGGKKSGGPSKGGKFGKPK